MTRTGILAFVPDLWDAPWQSRHYILSGLARRYKVLWISPPTYWSALRTGRGRDLFSGRGLKIVSNSLWVYAPLVPADYKRGPWEKGGWRGAPAWIFRRYNTAWRAAHVFRIRRLLDRMGVDQVILYVWRPEYRWALGSFSEALSCYHIDDEYSFNPSRDMPTSEEEATLLQNADLVFIHSRTLMRKKGTVNPNTHYIPNGVDFDLYRQALQSDEGAPKDLAAIPTPRIGYVGYIKRHIDLPLLLELARRRRDWSLVLIGPIRREHSELHDIIARLQAEPNVHFLGGKPAAWLPRYINGLDVCLMPYRKTAYTHYIYPMKMHEYFACGKPVVATELENLKEFADVLEFAEGPAEWTAAIERCLRDFTDADRNRRIEVASENRWAVRVERVAEEIGRLVRKNDERVAKWAL